MIQDYATLQTAIGNWINRSADANLTARIPEFIQLAESRLVRKIDDLDQELIASITFTNGIATLPADFDGLVAIDGDFDEDPIIYNVVEGELQTDPAVTGTATITYKQTLPSLSATNTTNWLLTRAPDIYLYSALIQAEFYGWNDERLPLIKSALDEAMMELNVDSEERRWGKVPVAPQLRRT